MACQVIDTQHIAAERTRLEQEALYIATSEGRSTVHFHFKPDPRLLPDSLFVIYSMRMKSAVYRGPYRNSVAVEFDGKMAADDHHDSIRFSLLSADHRRLCTWINERGEPYWSPEAQIHIDLLEGKALDRDNLPKMFDVSIR